MQKVAKSLQHHRRLLANWFHAKGEISSGVVEGFNGKTKLTIRKAYGLRTTEGIKSRCFTHLAGCLSRRVPTDSAEEAKLEVIRRPTARGEVAANAKKTLIARRQIDLAAG